MNKLYVLLFGLFLFAAGISGQNPDFIVDEDGTLTGYSGTGGDIMIPDGVISVGNSVFQGNEDITSVTGPASLKIIGENSFSACRSMISVTMIASALDSIAPNAFSSCTELTTVTLPPTLRIIDNYAFAYDSSLDNIIIPGSVTKIGTHAFTFCENLSAVTIPSSVSSVGDFAFASCSNLENITLSEGLSELGGGAFYYCKKLTSVIIPGSVSVIKTNTFGFCDALETVDITPGVITIENSAFAFCIGMKTLSLPEGLNSIGDNAFYQTSLSELTIPDSVTELGSYAFGEIATLQDIYVSRNPPLPLSTDYEYFSGFDPGTVNLYVPSGMEDLYNNAPVWRDFTVVPNIPTTIAVDLREKIKIYDNNETGMNVENAEGSYLSVYNTVGNVVYSGIVSSSFEKVNVPQKGVYIVRVNEDIVRKVLIK